MPPFLVGSRIQPNPRMERTSPFLIFTLVCITLCSLQLLLPCIHVRLEASPVGKKSLLFCPDVQGTATSDTGRFRCLSDSAVHKRELSGSLVSRGLHEFLPYFR